MNHRPVVYIITFAITVLACAGRAHATHYSEINGAFITASGTLSAGAGLFIPMLLVIGVAVVIGFAYYAVRMRRKLSQAQSELVRINSSKDRYIRELITLCGVYLSALENFNKLAGRKIKVGQVNDLLDMIESGKIVREQLQKFYEVFDEAFLMVYPEFVGRVNALLYDDKQLALCDGGRLSTELRILAFMRLGVNDSTQIAKFLGLSLNTVYTYRNKVKSRAVNRDKFEENIMGI